MSTLKVNTLTDTAATKSVPIEDVVNGVARAWVNFDGTTNTGGNCTIRASYNVTDVDDNATGDYTINFTNALTDTNYIILGSTSMRFGVNYNGAVSINTINATAGESAPTTTPCRISVRNSSATATDFPYFNVAIFR